MTRIETFETKTLPPTLKKPGVAEIFQQNAFEHVHWMVKFINDNRHLIDPEELFYEKGTERVKTAVDVAIEQKTRRLRNMRTRPVTHGVDGALADDYLHEVSFDGTLYMILTFIQEKMYHSEVISKGTMIHLLLPPPSQSSCVWYAWRKGEKMYHSAVIRKGSMIHLLLLSPMQASSCVWYE